MGCQRMGKMSKRPLTAKRAARHGVPKGAQTTTPYQSGPHGSKVWVCLREGRDSARRVGCHIELTRDDGHVFLVQPLHPIFVVRQ